eukprot:ctg_1223.g392
MQSSYASCRRPETLRRAFPWRESSVRPRKPLRISPQRSPAPLRNRAARRNAGGRSDTGALHVRQGDRRVAHTHTHYGVVRLWQEETGGRQDGGSAAARRAQVPPGGPMGSGGRQRSERFRAGGWHCGGDGDGCEGESASGDERGVRRQRVRSGDQGQQRDAAAGGRRAAGEAEIAGPATRARRSDDCTRGEPPSRPAPAQRLFLIRLVRQRPLSQSIFVARPG